MSDWKFYKGSKKRYKVYSCGYVASLYNKYGKRKQEKILTLTSLNERGYPIICLIINGKQKTRTLHRVIAEHFIPNPLKKRTINHKDLVKTNNNISNLEWATHQENSDHAVLNNVYSNRKKGEENAIAKLKNEDAIAIRQEYAMNKTTHENIANRYKVSKSVVTRIINNVSYKI